MADELIPLNIFIGDRSYRIKTLRKDEEVIRKTLKIINDKILEFKTQFSGKDMQDYISMVLIWYATQLQTNDPVNAEISSIQKLISSMNEKLDQVL